MGNFFAGDLISRRALLKKANHLVLFGDLYGAVVDAPAVDAVPVVPGNWCWITEDIYRCDNCGEMSHVKEVMGKPDWDYCPNCGAKLDGSVEMNEP